MSQSQLQITFLPPRTRRADPASSRRAESDLRRSGTLSGQQMIVTRLVSLHPGKNAKQLERLGSLNQIQLCRRLPECGLFQIQCGTFDSTWFPGCACGPWCEHVNAEMLCREYGRIRITDPHRRKNEYRFAGEQIELKVTDRIWERARIG